MKKIILSLALVAGFTCAVSAQDSKPEKLKEKKEKKEKKEFRSLSVDEKAKQSSMWAEKKLGLTSEQKEKWQGLAKERIEANEPIKTKLKGATLPEERKSMRDQIKSNNDKFETGVNQFLTDEQKTKLQKVKSDKMQHWKRGIDVIKRDQKQQGRSTNNSQQRSYCLILIYKQNRDQKTYTIPNYRDVDYIFKASQSI